MKTAIRIATSAGDLLRGAYGSSNHVRTKEDGSFVSEADMLSHDFILKELARHFPDHRILSEESPHALESEISVEPTWVIDPLDGTSNFLAHIPLFGVALALVVNKEVEIGLIYDPIHQEMFAAQKGKGATLNGVPLAVSKKEVPRGAMLFAGRGYKEKHRKRHAQIISALEQQTTYFRRLGSATIMLAYVAAGRADAVILTGSSSWDVVAGALLVKEAGGTISDYCGHPWTLSSGDLVATNGIIHDHLVEITRTIEDNACLL